MELKQFIEEALLSIVEGVESANEKKNRFRILGMKHNYGQDGNYVDFDVSLVVNEKTDSSAGIKAGGKVGLLNVVSVSMGSDLDESKTNASQNIQHIEFKVFVTEQ